MSQLALDFPAVAPHPPANGITHVCLPDFSLACGIGFLEKPKGDRVIFGWGTTAPTCVWCRSLGKAYCRHIGRAMQRRQA